MQGLANRKTILLVLIIMIISVLFVYKYIWPKYNYVTPETNNHDIYKPNSRFKADAPKETPIVSRKEYKPDRCILRKKVSDKEETIFDNENCNLDILKWKDYLIFLEVSGYSSEKKDIVLYAYDMKTDEKIKIYSLNENIDNYDRRPRSIYLGEIFDNTLFFNAGGYATDQILYSLDLSNIKSKPKLISDDELYSKISYSDGHHWVAGGFGDAGLSASKRALFDIKVQKIIGRTIETSSELGVGTSYIGADESRAFIAVFDDVSSPHLSEIHSLDLMKKKDPKIIISKKKIPPNVFRVVYMYDKKKIVLLGNDAYVYNLKEEKLEKIVSLKDVKFTWPNDIFGDAICISEKLKLDIKKKAIVSDETDCVHKSPALEKSIAKKIERFNLPSEYSFEVVKGQ